MQETYCSSCKACQYLCNNMADWDPSMSSNRKSGNPVPVRPRAKRTPACW